MSKIKKGDLVCIVRPRTCCNDKSAIGLIFRVGGFASTKNCINCGPIKKPIVTVEGETNGVEISRLIRLDPDALKDDVPTKEELHA